MLSASETPLFVTVIVNELAAPPAVTDVSGEGFVTVSWTSSTMSMLSSLVAAVVVSSDVAEAVLETVCASVVVSTEKCTVMIFVAPAPRWSSVQSTCWPLEVEQSKSPRVDRADDQCASTGSVTLTWSASETPLFVTSIVNGWPCRRP